MEPKNLNDYQMYEDPAGEAATDRVNETPALQPYRDLLLEYDWDEPDHLAWVATASDAEILSWCETVRQDNP